MTLWMLRPFSGHPAWSPWYDKAFGFIVRAETEAEARVMAMSEAGDEVSHERWGKVWLDPSMSTCEPLSANGPVGIVMVDFRSA